MRANRTAPDVLITVFRKRRERYLLVYEPAQAVEALRTLGRWASNPDLSFTWHDAATLSRMIRDNVAECRGK